MQTHVWTTISEAARALGISPPAVRQLMASGELTVKRVPGCWPRVSANDVLRLVDGAVSKAEKKAARPRVNEPRAEAASTR